MGKLNCWEYFKCGREPGGDKVDELGVCIASVCEECDGYLEGKNGGRACVYLSGTFCSGFVQGTYADKHKDCFKCDFYKLLKKENPEEMSVLKFGKYVRKNKGEE